MPQNAKLSVDADALWGEKHTVELHVCLPSSETTACSSRLPEEKGKRKTCYSRRTPDMNLHIDVYGLGLPGIARMFLPLMQGPWLRVERSDAEGKVLLKLGTSTSPKRQTVLTQLQKLERLDKIFIVELLAKAQGLNPDSLCVVAFRPSMLRAHLEGKRSGSVSAVVDGESLSQDVLEALRCRPRQTTVAGAFMRWALCPSAVILAGWLLLLKKDVVLQHIPAVPGFGWVALGPRLEQVLPAVPTTLLQAYDLGALCERLRTVSGEETRKEVLAAAALLLGRDVTAKDLEAIRDELVRILNHRSLGQKVQGLFTFVNTIWLCAIAGITVSVGPVLWDLLRPLRRIFVQLANKFKEALLWFMEKVILPTVSRLHELGFWEAFAHAAAFMLTVQGCRLQEGPGEFVAISGLVASLAASKYTYYLHGQVVARVLLKEYKFDVGSLMFLCSGLLFVPVAILHQSKLIGFASVGSLLAALGFSGAMYPFCYCIGWNSEDSMLRTAAASGLGVGAFAFAKVLGAEAEVLAPFAPGISVLGGLSHYLALLIRSNKWYKQYGTRDSPKLYYWYNCCMAASLGISQAVGRIYGLKGLANTSTTFLVLWMLEKSAELTDALNVSGWYVLLGGSIVTYYSALWLHANPSFVVSLFQSVA